MTEILHGPDILHTFKNTKIYEFTLNHKDKAENLSEIQATTLQHPV